MHIISAMKTQIKATTLSPVLLLVSLLIVNPFTIGIQAALTPQHCPYIPEKSPTLNNKHLTDMAPSHRHSTKTIYIVAHGNVVDRLAAVASAVTMAEHKKYNLVVVWERDAEECNATWPELFQSPELPLASTVSVGCVIQEVTSHEDFKTLHHHWKPLQDEEDEEALCISSSTSFVNDPSSQTRWFYQLLSPSNKILNTIHSFQDFHHWSAWGQWIGITICTSTDCIATSTTNNTPYKPPTSIQPYLDRAQQIKAFPVDGETVPRFFIVGSRKTEELALQTEMWTWNMTGVKGAAVSWPDEYLTSSSIHTSDSSSGSGSTTVSLHTRETVQQQRLSVLEEEVLKLYLLSRMNLLVGAVGSKVGTAAYLMGNTFYMPV